MYEQEQPPVERTPIPEVTYKPKEGDIGAWNFESIFSGRQDFTPMQFDFDSLMKFYYQQQAEEQGQAPISPRQEFVNQLQSYGRTNYE